MFPLPAPTPRTRAVPQPANPAQKLPRDPLAWVAQASAPPRAPSPRTRRPSRRCPPARPRHSPPAATPASPPPPPPAAPRARSSAPGESAPGLTEAAADGVEQPSLGSAPAGTAITGASKPPGTYSQGGADDPAAPSGAALDPGALTGGDAAAGSIDLETDSPPPADGTSGGSVAGGAGATGLIGATSPESATTIHSASGPELLDATSAEQAATDPAGEPWSARGPPAGSVLITAALGGTLTAGDATLTFAPGSLPADAYVSITPVAGIVDLNAYDAATGERISTFLIAPVLTLFAGRHLTDAPQILYLDPVLGPQAISSSYDGRTGLVSAALPHFSEYTSTFTSGAWAITLDGSNAHTITVSVDGTDLKIVVDGDPAETRALSTVTSLVITGGSADDTLIIDPSAAGYAASITFSGGGGEDTAELQLPDTGGSYTVTSVDPVAAKLEITVGGARRFTSAGLEHFKITGSDAMDTVVFTASAADFGEQFIFDGGDGEDTLVGPDKVTVWQINAENGGWFKAAPLDDFNFANVENLTGGTKIDAFNFSDGGFIEGDILSGGGNQQLDLGGFVFVEGDLNLVRTTGDITPAGSNVAGGNDELSGASFYIIGVQGGTLFVGSGHGTDQEIGFRGTIDKLALVIVTDSATGRTWFAVKAVVQVALVGIDGVTIDTGTLTIEFNSRASDESYLDFSTYDDADADDDPDTITAATLDIDFDTAKRFASAEGATVDFFGLVGGSADIAFEQSTVDVDLDGDFDTTDDQFLGASMLQFAIDNLNLHLGEGNVLVEITGGSLGMVSISAAAPADPAASQSSKWTAITSNGIGVSLKLGSPVEISVTNGSFKINTASGQFVPAPEAPGPGEPTPPLPDPVTATALKWADPTDPDAGFAVDVDGDGEGDLIDPGALLPATPDLGIGFTTETLAIAGRFQTRLFDFVELTADFEYTKSNVAVDLDPEDEANAGNPENASLITFGLDIVSVADGGTGLVIGDPDGVHFTVADGSLALAFLRAGAPSDAAATDDRVWTAIKAELTGATLAGLDDFDVVVDVFAIELNRFSGQLTPATGDPVLAAALDWTTTLNLDGDDSFGDSVLDQVEVVGVDIDFTEELTRASGRLTINNILGLLKGTVAFAFEQQDVNVDVDYDGANTYLPDTTGGDLEGAKMTSFAMLILADDGNDANGEELGLTIGEETGVHFKIESGSLLYVSVKPGAPATDDTRVFTAITANIANAELLGIDGVTAQIVTFSVDVNKAAGQYGTDPVAEALDWTGAIDADQDGNFEAPTFAVPTGADPIELSVTYEEDVFGASGRFIVNLFDFVTGDVDFKYVSTTEDVVISDTETLTDAQVTRLSLRVRSLFVGVPDGPGFRVSDSPEADGGDADEFAGTLVLASIKPSKADQQNATTPDERSWLAISADLDHASFEGIPNITLDFDSATLEINQAAGLKGTTEAEALDWTTAFLDGSGDPVVFEVEDLDGVQHPIEFDEERFQLQATVTFNAFDFVRGIVRITVAKEVVDVELKDELDNVTDTLTDAQLLTISLEINPDNSTDPADFLFIGVNGVGFEIEGGTIFIASLKAKKPALGSTDPADPRTWSAISSNITGARLAGLPEDFVLVADELEIQINQASGGTTPPDPLNWDADLDIDGNGVFGEDAEDVGTPDEDLKDSLIRGEGADAVAIDFDGKLLRVAGTLHLRIADFVYATGSFAIEKGDPIFVTPAGAEEQVEVSLLRVGISNANVFVGMGIPDSDGDGDFDADDVIGDTNGDGVYNPTGATADVNGDGTDDEPDDPEAFDSIGVALQDVNLALALMRQEPATVGGPPGPLSFTALKASGTAQLLGIPSVTLKGKLNVEFNGGKHATDVNAKPAVDFSKLEGGSLSVQTGPDPDGVGGDPAPSVAIDFETALMRASGTITLIISEFVFITADFAFQKSDEPVLVTLQDDDPDDGIDPLSGDATVMTIGASNGFAFFGTGGPYWDTNGDGKVTELDETPDPATTEAVGLAISNVSFALALLKPVVDPLNPTANDLHLYKSFTALKLKGNVALVGVEGVTANILNLTLEVNSAALTVPGANPAPAIDFSALDDGGLAVPIGPIPAGETEPPTLLLDYAGRRLRAGAYVELGFGGFVHISGSFVFEMGTVLNDQLLSNGTTKDLSVMKIGASNVNVFLGDGGPYWVDSNGDGVINTNPADAIADDTPDAAGAVGIALGGVEVAVVLLKTVPPATPTTPATPALSYYAISAHADSIALVGVDGVTVQGTSIDVAVNGGGGAPTGTAPNQIPAPVVDFNGAADDESLPVTVDIETGATRDIAFDGFVLEASGTITVAFDGFSIVTTIAFSQALRSNGQKVTKISLTETSFSVGIGDPAFTISGANGFILLTPDGMAAQIDVAETTVNIGSDFTFSTAFSVKINNTNKLVNEEFIVPGTGPFVLELPAGPYLRIEATDVDLTLKGFAFHADAIAIERIVKVPGTPPVQLTRFIATGVSASTFTATDLEGASTGFSITNGRMAFVIYPGTPAAGGGVAGIVSGTITLDTGGALDIEGAATLQVNRTNVQRKESIPAGDGTASFDLTPNTFKIAVRQLSIRVLDIFELTGDFFFEDRPGRKVYGARNATLFLGQRNSDDLTDFTGAVGVRITDASVAVVRFLNDVNREDDDTYAVTAFGRAELLGIPGLVVTGSLRVRINTTGQVVADTITLPQLLDGIDNDGDTEIDEADEDDGIDNDNDGTTDELAERQINVNFASGVRTEVFEVGARPVRPPAPAAQARRGRHLRRRGQHALHPPPERAARGRRAQRLGEDLDPARRRQPAGDHQALRRRALLLRRPGRLPAAGPARQRLRAVRPDDRRRGRAVGERPAPGRGRPGRAVQRPERPDLLLRRRRALHRRDLPRPQLPGPQRASRSSTPGDEFVLTGPGANVAVNGAAVQVDPTNPFLFRYFLTKINSGEDLFTLGGNPADPRNTVRIEFLANSFQNSLGATNAADFESFYLFQEPPASPRSRPGKRRPRPRSRPRCSRARSPARR